MGVEIFTGTFFVTISIVSTLILLLYRFSVKNHDYWKKRGIPQTKTAPFFGSTYEFFRMPVHEVEMKRYKEYGTIYGHYERDRQVLSVAEPTMLKDILVKDYNVFINRREIEFGDEMFDKMLFMAKNDDWKRIRTIISPTFTTGKIKRVHGIFQECTKTVIKNFKTAVEIGEPVSPRRYFGAYTMDVIASSAFSTKIDSHNNPDNEFVTNAQNLFRQPLWRMLAVFLFPQLVRWFKIELSPGNVMGFFKEVVGQIMEERRRTGQVRNDFLQLLMDTEKETSMQDQNSENIGQEAPDSCSNFEHEGMNPTIFKNVTSKRLSLNELVSQCVVFLTVGFDTTASALSFASYLLALNPEAQDKLREEVDQAFRESGDVELSYESVQNMKYLNNVISETLRLYPPVTRVERTAAADYKLADSGIVLEKGTVVSMPVYAIHRDARHFPDPERFDPDRFTTEEKAKRDPYAYLPFGAGPRNCVGMRFALIETKVCLAYVIRNFNLMRSPQTKVPLTFGLGQSVLQADDVTIDMEVRDTANI